MNEPGWGTPTARSIITEVEKRADAATPGDWHVGYLINGWTIQAVTEPVITVTERISEQDAVFAAQARKRVPQMAEALLCVLDLIDESDKVRRGELLARGDEGAHRRGYALALHEVRLLINEALDVA